MTQQVVRARIILRYVDPTKGRASFSTTWEQIGSDTDVNIASIQNDLGAFLNDVNAGQAHPMAYYLSPAISRAATDSTIEIYDVTAHLDGTPTGPPIYAHNFALATAGASGHSLPEGVSALFWLHADYGTDAEFGSHTRPRARDRNRFYLGPLNDSAIQQQSVTNISVLSDQFLADAALALQQLGHSSPGPADETQPVVWSRKNAGVKQVAARGIDLRPKYQRRRALA
jgi:hypothetical protein